MKQKPLKIVYLTPALYMAGGVERVLTLKANYFADHFGYDITVILTEGKDKPLFYPLSDKIRVVNLNIGFEELWTCSFLKKIFVYLNKQRKYKKLLSEQLMCMHPDITVSLLRREINFLNSIHDGSKKVGELHVNRANYRNFEANDSNFVKNLFAKFWMHSLVMKLRNLDRFIVLTEEDKNAWPELKNICVIPDPLTFVPTKHSELKEKRVIAVGRYVYQKGKTIRTPKMSLIFIENTRGFTRFAVVVSKKVEKTAVGRNRIRRRIYEILRNNIELIPKKMDYGFVVFSNDVLRMPKNELEKILGKLVEESKVCYNKKNG